MSLPHKKNPIWGQRQTFREVRLLLYRSYLNDRSNFRAAIKIGLALRSEFDDARDEGEKGVVFADADVAASHDLRAALADDDLADIDE